MIDEVGDLPGFGTAVWVHQKGLATVLSFYAVNDKQGYHVQYSSVKPNGNIQRFATSYRYYNLLTS